MSWASIRIAVRASQHTVLANDRSLLCGVEPGEGARAAEWGTRWPTATPRSAPSGEDASGASRRDRPRSPRRRCVRTSRAPGGLERATNGSLLRRSRNPFTKNAGPRAYRGRPRRGDRPRPIEHAFVPGASRARTSRLHVGAEREDLELQEQPAARFFRRAVLADIDGWLHVRGSLAQAASLLRVCISEWEIRLRPRDRRSGHDHARARRSSAPRSRRAATAAG
jgi:hypothetical protein